MVTKEGDLIFDPMSGSGTTGEFAKLRERKAILADHSEEYTRIAETRLAVERIKIDIPQVI
jgi:site-specific DNA-methyltransferase (adenine-specific)